MIEYTYHGGIRQEGLTVQDTAGLMDLIGPGTIEVRISSDAKNLWINADGICVLRACVVSIVLENDANPGVGNGRVMPFVDPQQGLKST